MPIGTYLARGGQKRTYFEARVGGHTGLRLRVGIATVPIVEMRTDEWLPVVKQVHLELDETGEVVLEMLSLDGVPAKVKDLTCRPVRGTPGRKERADEGDSSGVRRQRNG